VPEKTHMFAEGAVSAEATTATMPPLKDVSIKTKSLCSILNCIQCSILLAIQLLLFVGLSELLFKTKYSDGPSNDARDVVRTFFDVKTVASASASEFNSFLVCSNLRRKSVAKFYNSIRFDNLGEQIFAKHVCCSPGACNLGARKLTGDNLKVV